MAVTKDFWLVLEEELIAAAKDFRADMQESETEELRDIVEDLFEMAARAGNVGTKQLLTSERLKAAKRFHEGFSHLHAVSCEVIDIALDVADKRVYGIEYAG